MTVVFLILALVVILASAELFTNSVEWFGRRYSLGEGAVGSVLAAVGTALPETLLPIMALAFLGGDAGRKIGTGAILGAPFMLSSLAMFVTGAAVIRYSLSGRRSITVTVNETVTRRDLTHFLRSYALVMLASFFHIRALHWGLAALLVGLYAWYVYKTLKEEGDLGVSRSPCTSIAATRPTCRTRGASSSSCSSRWRASSGEPSYSWRRCATPPTPSAPAR